MFTRPFDLKFEKLALALEEPGSEPTHHFGSEDEARQAEHWAVLVSAVSTADVGANKSEFIKVGEVRHRWGFRKQKSPLRSTGIGKRATQACISENNYTSLKDDLSRMAGDGDTLENAR